MRVSAVLGCWLASAAWAASAAAESGADGVTAPAGGAQVALAARVVGSSIVYRACAQAPCTASSGDASIPLGSGASPQDVTIDSLAIGNGRHVVFAHAPTFGALIAAVPGGHEARVLWSGALGFAKGEPGERYGEQIDVTEPEADKTVHVLLGEVREDVHICGRTSLLSPKLLDARDLAFKNVRLQRLKRDERDRAPTLTAQASSGEPAQAMGRVLQGASASSGIGAPGSLTDGNLDTTWSEQRGGDGAGEFVQFNAPEQVAITSVSIVARPATKDVPKGAGVRKVWLATNDALYGVEFPQDPWAKPGASFEVKLPAPVRTRCLALVLDEAYTKGRQDVDVTLAEVTAHTEFDTSTDPAALAGALAGGQDRARMAAAILLRSGERGHQAVADAYPTLDDQGRVLALEIIDSAPCARSAPLYVKAMEIGRPGEVHHAIDRLTRCGKDAAPALSTAIDGGSDVQKARAANLLVLLAPDLAVQKLVPLLPAAKQELRAEYRSALSKAAQSPAAKDALAAKLGDPALPPVAAIDLLRAVTSRQTPVANAPAAFARLATPDAEFRTRYLLLAPAAELAHEGDARAEAFLLGAIAVDPDGHVRAHAAELADDLPKALPALEKVLADPDPRVRDASIVAIGRLADPKGAKVQTQPWSPGLFPGIAGLLESDPFTFVRGHAADALTFAPASDDTDGALARALEDKSPMVRAHVVDTLGRRGAVRYAGEIRERLDDENETLDVKSRAARALGRVCDAKSADRLTELARKASERGAPGDALVIAASAAAGLGRLNPPDLGKRLAPLSDKGAPKVAQEIAKSALSTTDRCR